PAPGRSPAPGTSYATGTSTAFGAHPTSSGTGTAPGTGQARGGAGPLVPAQGAAPGAESRGAPEDRPPAHDPRATAAAAPYDEAGRHPEADDGGPDTGGRKATPLRGTDAPQGLRRRGGFGAWARRLAGGRGTQARGAAGDGAAGDGAAPHPFGRVPATGLPETWPDPAALLLAALGPGPRLWERGPDHPEVLTVRLGTADRPAPDGSGRLVPAVAVTAALREVGALGLAGPRARLAGLARAVLAQLAALHSPELLEIVLLSADEDRPLRERTEEWSWLGWLPHVRPRHGQDCRLLLAFDAAQAAARIEELLRRLDDHPGGAREHGVGGHRPSWARDGAGGRDRRPASFTVVVVDGDPGDDAVRQELVRLTLHGPRAGIHVVCLAEAAPASPASPLTESYRAACAASAVFRECGAVALLSGDVATALRLMRVAPAGPGERMPLTPGAVATVDAVSAAWAERFARALAPLRPATGGRPARVCAPLPPTARLLDELGLARATPASLQARWANAAEDTAAPGGRARAILGAGPHGPLAADLVADGPHLLIEGPAGSGRTELLRSVVASLAAAERPDRLGVVLVDGRDGTGAAGEPADGLRVCTDLPHVTTHLCANDPLRMRDFAQSLTAELKRRAELLGREDFAAWHTRRRLPGRIVAQRTASGRGSAVVVPDGSGTTEAGAAAGATLRLRPAAGQRTEQAPPLPRLVVVVDDLDALVTPALGAPGRPAAGSVVRALEAVARDGGRLGVHLVAAALPEDRTARSEPARRAALRITLDAPGSGPQQPGPGRGRLTGPDGTVTPFQGGRITGRIPRTATQRPTVVPVQWERMGDPPTRRTVRELGNGPTDLALLASALERAADQVAAARAPSLL
ncbi:FtsK/SpoIIIE domain-containing protein, partial [Streptomyces sp. WAC00469]|uniref:FtsK/SpoIIIE domain-containing protein n=3 Tax=Streptomyces TaxID=1883 RepID=UPI000F748927